MRIGVAPGVRRALIGKVLGKGGGTSESLLQAVLWASEQGAHVVSMSLGMDFPGMVKDLIEQDRVPSPLATSWALEAYRANVLLFERLAALLGTRQQSTLLIAAAGNESRMELDPHYAINVSPPAVSEGIVSVAALGQGDDGLAMAPFSNIGALVGAPGVDIVSAGLDGTLVSMSGTSMAAPHVAGVAALWAQRLLAHGSVRTNSLSAQVLGNAVFTGLVAGIDAAAIGSGLVQAPPPA
jgi:subtilisin family serine protease